MNKLQLIDIVANKMHITKRDAAQIVEAVFGIIKNCLKEDEAINIGGFGEFKVRKRASRPGVNPQSGEKIQIAESTVPSFRPSKALKDLIS